MTNTLGMSENGNGLAVLLNGFDELTRAAWDDEVDVLGVEL